MNYKWIAAVCLAVLTTSVLQAEPLKVMIQNRQKKLDISMFQNYAVVVGEKHFYGPVDPKYPLRVEWVKGGRLKISVGDGKGKFTPIVATSERVDVVRGFRGTDLFKRTFAPLDLKKRMLQEGALNLNAQGYKDTPFFRFKHSQFGGFITYTGALSLHVRDNPKDTFYLVETIDSELYLRHVVNCELGGSESLEALKAQAVMSRTFALYHVKERRAQRKPGSASWSTFDVMGGSSDQAYNCRMRVNDKQLPSDLVVKAVTATRGMVQLQKGKLIPAQYCAHCGKCAYCRANDRNATPNGNGACQNGVNYYGEKGSKYQKILKTYYANTYTERYADQQTVNRVRKQLTAELQKTQSVQKKTQKKTTKRAGKHT